MTEGFYGREPFDLRLTVLRLLGQWKKIVLFTMAGMLLFVGLYSTKNILLRGETQYRAVSVYRMEYQAADENLGFAMINSYTWNTYVHTEEFLGFVMNRLDSDALSGLTEQTLGSYIQGTMESDARVPSTIVVTGDAVLSSKIAAAVEMVLTQDFPAGISEVEAIRVLDHAGEAEELVPELRFGRAFLLGAVLSLFFTLVILLLKETGDDSLWLPSTLLHRYGLKTLWQSTDFAEEMQYLFAGKEQIAVCPVQGGTDSAELVRQIEEKNPVLQTQEYRLIAIPSPLSCPESAQKLRAADGILLLVLSGAHAGKQTEYVLDYLAQQDCKVTAALLWETDDKLIRRYYGLKRGATSASGEGK